MDVSLTPGEAARILGISVRTLHRWDKAGKIRCEWTPGGRRRVPESEVRRFKGESRPLLHRAALYARVSSHEQKAKGDLSRQMERLRRAISPGEELIREVAEVGSGLNDQRKGLSSLLAAIRKRVIDVVIVEHPDRLTRFGNPPTACGGGRRPRPRCARFGFHYLTTFAEAHGTEIRVLEPAPPEERELVEDMIAIVSSFAGKLYGMRSARRRKVKAAVEAVVKDR